MVFERATYGGRSHVLPIGSYPSLPGWTNDSISSVKVPPGRILHLYDIVDASLHRLISSGSVLLMFQQLLC